MKRMVIRAAALGLLMLVGCGPVEPQSLPQVPGPVVEKDAGTPACECDAVGEKIPCGERYCLSSVELECIGPNQQRPTGDLCGTDGGAPSDAGSPQDGGHVEPDAGQPPECPLLTFQAPTKRCSAATAQCLQVATTAAAEDACFAADTDCVSCINEEFSHCLMGTAAAPGRCAHEFGCLYGCATAVCDDLNDQTCINQALAGPCASQKATYDTCSDPNDNKNGPCAQAATALCIPQPGCGDGVVNANEKCDGNCPTSCPPSSNPCTQWTLVGSPATCNAQCVEVPVKPSCGSRVCGDDGCGGSCGTCSGQNVCSAAGQCVCAPQCAGKTCGPDGCGGSCGSCPSGVSCTPAGTCDTPCVPQCAGRVCGSDGCGGSCGSCGGSQTCSGGQCCTPSCAGKTCGSNGCGGSCGSCSGSSQCVNGTCQSDPDDCDPVYNTGCAAPNECWLLSSEKTVCAVTGSGTQGSSCSSTSSCSGGYGCFAGTCRKVCDLNSGAGCDFGETCIGVTGWFSHGACG
jgi:hypothetical protein